MFRQNYRANRNNWAIPFTGYNVIRFGVLLVGCAWVLYLFSVVYSGGRFYISDTIYWRRFYIRSLGLEYQMKQYRRINEKIDKIDPLIATSQSKLNDAIYNMNDKYGDLQPVEENEKFWRGLKEHIKKETLLEQTVSNTLPHGKDDGVNKSYEEGAPIKKKTNIQTEPDQSKSSDGIFHVNKIEEKGALIKIKANIQTKPDQSKLNDGVCSFSDENGIPQNVPDSHSFSDENGILQHVLDKYFGMKPTEAEKETDPDQSNLDDEDHSFSDENGPLQHVYDKYVSHDDKIKRESRSMFLSIFERSQLRKKKKPAVKSYNHLHRNW